MSADPFHCPGCNQRLNIDGPVCARCWPAVPVALRDAWLRVCDAVADEGAVRAINLHFGRRLQFVRTRRHFPAATMDGDAEVLDLLICSPYFKADQRAGGRRWKCQGCDKPACKDGQSICDACFASLPWSLCDAWGNAGMEEDGPEWEAIVEWLDNRLTATA